MSFRAGFGQKHKAGSGWGVVVGSNSYELRADAEDGVRRCWISERNLFGKCTVRGATDIV
jgi:hypothetical protein